MGPVGRCVCIVVHHKAFPGVLETIDLLLESGIAAEDMYVIDNSENDDVVRALRGSIPKDVTLHVTPNRGYGAAVNFAVARLSQSEPAPEFVVVSTHETRPALDAVGTILDAMLIDPSIAVAGPTLTDIRTGDNKIWSTGGVLSRLLRLPKHPEIGKNFDVVSTSKRDAVDREWLDGAFCVYRYSAIATRPIDESYFMYFEETDLHTRLKKSGGRVLWVPGAIVGQESGGIPPRLLGRNLPRFLRANGRPGLRVLATALTLVRTLLREGTGRLPKGASSEFVRGWNEYGQEKRMLRHSALSRS